MKNTGVKTTNLISKLEEQFDCNLKDFHSETNSYGITRTTYQPSDESRIEQVIINETKDGTVKSYEIFNTLTMDREEYTDMALTSNWVNAI